MTAEKFCNQYGLGGSDRFTVIKMLGSADLSEDDFKKAVIKKCNLNPSLFASKEKTLGGKVVIPASKKATDDSAK